MLLYKYYNLTGERITRDEVRSSLEEASPLSEDKARAIIAEKAQDVFTFDDNAVARIRPVRRPVCNLRKLCSDVLRYKYSHASSRWSISGDEVRRALIDAGVPLEDHPS